MHLLPTSILNRPAFALCSEKKISSSPDLRFGASSGCRDGRIRLRPPVTIKLPGIADLANQVEIKIRDDNVVGVPRAFGQNAAARVAEVTLSIEFPDPPRLFPGGAINRAHKV